MARQLAAFAACIVFLASAAEADNWQIETVDESGTAWNSSMKFDKDGNAHVCYLLAGGVALKYAFWEHSLKRWFTMVVAESSNGCALALDSKQQPHISYNDYGTAIGAKLRYAHWDGTSWKKQVIPLNSETIASYTSIALDANDNPSISFYEYRGPKDTDIKIRLRNVMWNGKYWEVRTVDPDEGSGKINSMIADSLGHFHLGYAEVTTGEMRYAYWNGKSWKLEMVESREQSHLQYVGLNSAITVDKQGNPHVTYLNSATLQIKYAVRKNGHWDIEVVDRIMGLPGPSLLDRNSIVVDDEGRPYIGYYDARLGILKVAHKEGQNWVVETVDGNQCGFNSSLQIDRGVIWISYADDANGALKVAHRKLENRDTSGGMRIPAPPAPSAHVAGPAGK